LPGSAVTVGLGSRQSAASGGENVIGLPLGDVISCVGKSGNVSGAPAAVTKRGAATAAGTAKASKLLAPTTCGSEKPSETCKLAVRVPDVVNAW